MKNWFLSLFNRSPAAEELSCDLEVLKKDVERVLELDLATSELREEHSEFVLHTLQELSNEIQNIKVQANGYPENPMPALVWMNGAACGNFASALTQHFQTSGWLEHEQNASAMWAHATLAVCSHYHHMVGPAMLANADCHDRLGNTEQGTQMCLSVAKDFAFLIDDWMDSSVGPQEEDRLAIESLETALQRLRDRGIHKVDGIDLDLLFADTQIVLRRPTPDAR